MVAIGVWGTLHPDFVQELNRFPRECKRRLKRIEPILKLMAKQQVIENRFAERSAMFRIRKRVRHGALRQRDAHDAVSYAREIQHFEDQINSRVRRTEQVSLALFHL